MIDVPGAADQRHKEIDNLRGGSRILANQLEDPDIDHKVLVQGNVPGVMVPPPGP